MADGLENSMTFYFGAEDRASDAATNAEKIVEAAGEGIENTLLSMTTNVEQLTEAAGAGTEELSEFADSVEAAMNAAMAAGPTQPTAIEGFHDSAQEAHAAAAKLITVETILAAKTNILAGAYGVLAGSFKKTLSIGGTLLATLSVIARTAGKSLKSVGGAVDIGKVAGGALGAGGGILSALLGPIGPILKLLEPLLNILSNMLAPAIDAIGAAVETAFAPFSYVVEEVAMNLQPLIRKGLQPIVALMTRLALQVGKVFSGKTSGAMSKATSLFLKISMAVGDLARKVLPIALGVFERIIPFAEKIGEHLGALALRIVPVLGNVFEKVGPMMVDTFGKLLEAVAPLIPPLTELAAVLIEKVFGPLLIQSIQGVLGLVQKLIPYLTEYVPIIAAAIGDVADQVGEFYGNFEKYMAQFAGAFAPEIESVRRFGAVVSEVFGAILDKIQPIIDGIKTLLKLMPSTAEKTQAAVDEAAKASLGTNIKAGEIESARTSEAARNRDVAARLARGEDISDLVAKARTPKADGGVVKGRADVTVGEAGQELILPRTSEAIEGFVKPILSGVELPSVPGLEMAAMWLQRIYDRLGSPLLVRQESAPLQQQHQAVESELSSTLGMSGLSV
jgi:hypothetical protein